MEAEISAEKAKKKRKWSGISRGKFHLYEQEQNSEAIMKKKIDRNSKPL